MLVAAVISLWAREPFLGMLGRSAYWTAVPFAIMASASVVLAVLWERSPALLGGLAGPLVAIVLYQRSVHGSLAAMRLALTDPLTGLGNARHFRERLEAELDRADAHGSPVSLCLIDVDDLKHTNDTYGHEAGDRVLVAVAGCLRHGGEAFRFGGDEFALVLPGVAAGEAMAVAAAIGARLAGVERAPGEPATVSIGVAAYPDDGDDRSGLFRRADSALYEGKRSGKAVVHPFRATTAAEAAA